MAFKFENLNVWHKSLELSDEINELAKVFPNYELYNLCHQIRKAADSVNLNIADATLNYTFKKANVKPLFSEKTSSFLAHKENDYIDFDYEGLISKMLSQEGPSLAVADINGDGKVSYTGLGNDAAALLSSLSGNQAAVLTEHQ